MIRQAWKITLAVSLLLPNLVFGFTWQAPTSNRALDNHWRDFLAQAAALPATPGLPFESCFVDAATANDLPVVLLQAVARGESDFDPRAVSHADALGVMQILWPGTAGDLGIHTRSQAFDACTNIDAGARYLSQMLARYDNNLHAALVAYNRGPANVDRLLKRNQLTQQSWYSGYIWDHLGFVLSRRDGPSQDYASSRRLVFITFSMPFRAEDLVQLLRRRASDARYDWFKKSVGGFAVALHYENEQQRREGVAQLQRMGLLRRDK